MSVGIVDDKISHFEPNVLLLQKCMLGVDWGTQVNSHNCLKSLLEWTYSIFFLKIINAMLKLSGKVNFW